MAYAIFFLSLLAVPASLCAAIWSMDLRLYLVFAVTIGNAAFWVAVMAGVVGRTK